jgi:PPOX class probable F420-dependent enzyme
MSHTEPAAYPQPPPLADEQLETFLGQAPIARLGTHNEDGTIHIAPIWFEFTGGQLLMPTQDITRKVNNIKRNNQVTVLIDTQEPPYTGVLIYGKAALDYDDVFRKKTSIYLKYFAEEDAPDPQKLARRFKPVVIRITPERIVTFGEGDN